jgi:hypothetical protein
MVDEARRTLDPEVALDLTAETFAEAFEHRHRLRGSTEREALGWLWAIADHQLAAGAGARGMGASRRVARRHFVPRVASGTFCRYRRHNVPHDRRSVSGGTLCR